MTLIKSMLSSILTYFMSLGTMPTHVAHKLEKLQNDFLRGGIGDSKVLFGGLECGLLPHQRGNFKYQKTQFINSITSWEVVMEIRSRTVPYLEEIYL